MTEVRQQMIRTMDLRNLSKNSKIAYLRAVTGLTKHYRKSPDTITEEMIEDYLLYLKNQKGRAPSGIHSELTGLRFFYKYVLNKQIEIGFTLTNKPLKLPTVLTQDHLATCFHLLKKRRQTFNKMFLSPKRYRQPFEKIDPALIVFK